MNNKQEDNIFSYTSKTMRLLRDNQNLTQEYVAEKLKISPQTYSRYEKSGKIQLDVLEKIVIMFKLKDLEAFFRKCYLLKSTFKDDNESEDENSPDSR